MVAEQYTAHLCVASSIRAMPETEIPSGEVASFYIEQIEIFHDARSALFYVLRHQNISLFRCENTPVFASIVTDLNKEKIDECKKR